MNRREAIKNVGLGVGFLVATPTVFSLLQSCKSEPEFLPVFVSKEDGKSLREIVGLIIPSDEQIPGAKELGIYTFVDSFWKEMLPEEEQAFVRIGMSALNTAFRKKFQKEMHKGTPEELDQLLNTYLKSSKEQQKTYNEKLGEFMKFFENNPSVKPDQDAAAFAMLGGIRELTIWGWKLHKQIGEDVLWYDPIPGEQKGCIPLNEAGNGNVMSLQW